MDGLDQKFAEEHRKEYDMLWDTINRAKSEPLTADE
jgi:hypothetical protein